MNWKKLIATGEATLGRSYQEAVDLVRTAEWWRDFATELLIKLQKNQEAAVEALRLLQIDWGEFYLAKAVDCNSAVVFLKRIVED